MAVRGVIFDLDGVIYDSQEANVAFYNHILTAIGLPPEAHKHRDAIHREAMEGALLAVCGGPGPHFERAMEYWRGLDPTPFIDNLTLFPHVPEVLALLAARLPLAVATNRTSTTRPSLRRFGLLGHFQAVVTPLEAGRPKPHPVVMEMALQRLNLSADEVFYVGDSSVDQQLCQAAGVRLAAFRNRDLEAWAHLDDFREIIQLLERG